MKKFLILLMLAFSINLYADNKKVDLEKELLSITSLTADFTQTNTLEDFGEDVYKGTVYIKMKDKALWDYKEPYASWYLFTKDSIEQYDEINNQLVKFGAEEARENVLLQVLMDISSIKKNFISKKIDDNTIRYSPKKNYGIKYIDIIFKDGKINTLKSVDGTNNSTEIVLENVKLNGKINDSSFKKKLPKDVTVFEN